MDGILSTILELQGDASGAISAMTEVQGRMQTLNEKAGSIGAGFIAVGAGLSAIGAAGTDFFKNALDASMNYQTMLTQIHNNTTMSDADINQMSDSIKKVAVDSNVPLTKLGDAYMHISNFGFKGAQATQVLEMAMKSASSTGGDTAKTAELLANVMHEYGNSTYSAQQAVDILHVAAQRGNATFEKFASNASVAIGTAANIGVPLQQVAAAESALTQHSFDAAKAQTQIVNIMTHLVHLTHGQSVAFDELSYKTGDLALQSDNIGKLLNQQGLTGVIEHLGAAYKKMGYSQDEAQTETFLLMNAQRGGLGMMSLLGTANKDYNDTLAAMAQQSDTNSATNDAYARSQQTLGYQLGELGNRFQILIMAIGDKLIPIFEQVVGWVQKIIDWWNSLDGGTQDLIVKIGLFVTALGAIGGPILLLVGMFGLILPGIVAVGSAMLPVIAIIGALVGVGYVLYRAWTENWGGIRDAVMSVWNQYLKPVFEQAEAWFKDMLPKAMKMLGDFWNNTLMPMLKEGFHWLATVGIPTFMQVAKAISDAIGPIVKTIGDWLGKNLPIAINWLQTTLPPILSAIGQAIGFIANAIGTFLSGAWPGFVQALSGIWDAVSNAIKFVWDLLTGLIQFLTDVFQGNWGAAWQDIVNMATNLWNDLINVVVGLLTGLWGIISGILSGLGINLGDVWNGIVSTAQGIWNGLVSFLTGLWNSIAGLWNGLWQGIHDTVMGFLQPIIDWITARLVDFWRQWGGTLTALKQAWDTFWNDIQQLIQFAWGKISGWFSDQFAQWQDTWDKVTSAVKLLWDTAWTFIHTKFHQYFDPIIQWVKDKFDEMHTKWNDILEQIKTLWNTAWSYIQQVWNQYFPPVQQDFTDRVNTIQELWNTVTTALTTAWNNVWNGLGDVVKNAMNTALDYIVTGINDVIDAFNNLITTINQAPGVHLSPLQHVPMPRLAAGGIVTGPMIAMIGEAGPEAVIPLNSNQGQGMLAGAGEGGGGGRHVVNNIRKVENNFNTDTQRWERRQRIAAWDLG